MLNVMYVMKVSTIHSYEAGSHDLDTYNDPQSPIGATTLTGLSQTDKVLYLRNVNDDRQYT